MQRESQAVVEKAVGELAFAWPGKPRGCRTPSGNRRKRHGNWRTRLETPRWRECRSRRRRRCNGRSSIWQMPSSKRRNCKIAFFNRCNWLPRRHRNSKATRANRCSRRRNRPCSKRSSDCGKRLARYPTEFEAACRDRITKVEEELDQKELRDAAFGLRSAFENVGVVSEKSADD